MTTTRRVGKKILFDLFFGIGAIDALFLGGAFVLGSYFLIDMPLNAALFIGALYGFASPARPRLAQAMLFVTFVLFLVLSVSAVAPMLVPRYEPAGFRLRMLHMLAGRFFLLVFVPYLFLHVRSVWTDAPRWLPGVTRFGWMLLKASLWAGALMGLLAIKGQLLPTHAALLVVGTPLVLVHIGMSLRRRRNGAAPADVRPFRILDRLTWARTAAAVVVAGAVTVGFALLPIDSGVWNLVAPPDQRALPGVVDLAPSPARLAEGGYIRSQFLGQSAGCGAEDWCHPIVLSQWRDSAHRNSVTWRYRRDLEAAVRTRGVAFGRVCAGCHDPISLYSGQVDFAKGLSSPDGRREGISCLVCHGLRALEDVPANGALAFRYPEYYGRITAESWSVIPFLPEHRSDFDSPDYKDDRVCIACHRFRPVPGYDPEGTPPEWISRPYHQQPRMTPACRGGSGCVTCHMPRSEDADTEKPGSPLPDHGFALRWLPPERARPPVATPPAVTPPAVTPPAGREGVVP